MLTKSCGLVCGNSIDKVLASGDDALLRSISIDCHFHHVFSHNHRLVVHSFFNINHIPASSTIANKKVELKKKKKKELYETNSVYVFTYRPLRFVGIALRASLMVV